MRISVTEATGQLTELVRRAEAGDEIILTRSGRPVVRLVPFKRVLDRKRRRKLLEKVRASGAAKASAGPSAARTQDFLYDEDGLPTSRVPSLGRLLMDAPLEPGDLPGRNRMRKRDADV
jgi:prevent-host-death family protein